MTDVPTSALLDLTGRSVIVTGGGSGMGRASAHRLTEAGARVLVVDIDGAAAKAVCDELPVGSAVAHAADAGTEAGAASYVAAALDAFGAIDAFHSNAGILGRPSPLLDATIDDWQRIMAVNLLGTFLGVRAVGRVMRDAGHGAIVVTASIAGLRSSPGVGIYAASKAGVVSLVRTAAKELGPAGVRVNAICPGPTVTNFSPGLAENVGQVEVMSERVPLGRLAQPDDMARTVLWLLSDGAAYLNGAVLPVDGGHEA